MQPQLHNIVGGWLDEYAHLTPFDRTCIYKSKSTFIQWNLCLHGITVAINCTTISLAL